MIFYFYFQYYFIPFLILICCCIQLFQNILTSTELQFPQGALEELHPDCVDLCRSLLRQDPGTVAVVLIAVYLFPRWEGGIVVVGV